MELKKINMYSKERTDLKFALKSDILDFSKIVDSLLRPVTDIKEILRDKTKIYFPVRDIVTIHKHLNDIKRTDRTSYDDLVNELNQFGVIAAQCDYDNVRRYHYEGFDTWFRLNASTNPITIFFEVNNISELTFTLSTSISVNGTTGKIAANYSGVHLTFTIYDADDNIIDSKNIVTLDYYLNQELSEVVKMNLTFTSNSTIRKLIISSDDTEVLFNWYELIAKTNLYQEVYTYKEISFYNLELELLILLLLNKITILELKLELDEAEIELLENIISNLPEIGDRQIFYKEHLPGPSKLWKDKFVFYNGEIYECTSEENSRIFSFENVTGTLEINDPSLIYNLIASDFSDYINFDNFVKVFRNSGEIRLGTGSNLGSMDFIFIINPLLELSFNIKTWNESKNANFILSTTNASQEVSLEASAQWLLVQVDLDLIDDINIDGNLSLVTTSTAGDRRIRMLDINVKYSG